MARLSKHASDNMRDLKSQRTLVLIKPDGVQRHLVGEIIHRFERAGLKIVGMKLVRATPETIEQHYRTDENYLRSIGEKTIEGMQKLGLPAAGSAVEIGRRVRSYLRNHLSISPVVAMVLQGTNAVRNIRQLVGTTDPLLADVGSIRGDLTIDTIQLANLEERSVRNLIHASGDPAEAAREIAIWFSPDELYTYQTVMDVVLHDEHWDRPHARAAIRRARERRGPRAGHPAGFASRIRRGPRAGHPYGFSKKILRGPRARRRGNAERT